MLTNFHTHTTFCDGKNTAEEIVLAAIEKGFQAIGFSGHGYTEGDLRYCMKDTTEYIATIRNLKEKYKSKIQIYLGVEEDASGKVDRDKFDYIIGSSHYFCIDGKYYPIDSDYNYFEKCIEVFHGDIIRLAETYFRNFCSYISRRKPDIIGHFDLITKFDEVHPVGFLCNDKYNELAEKYILEALKSDCIFEVNTGAIARGYRTRPYPSERLLYTLKKYDGRVMLSSDAHSVETLEFYFKETRKMLRDIGFEYVYMIYNNAWKRDYL